MAYTNSSLVTYKNLSPNNSGTRTHSIDRITPHCIVGQWTAKQACDYFNNSSRKASCNYAIGKDGSIGLCVEEKNRSWCSSSSANDQRAITIECASDTTSPYTMTDAVYKALINLCTDICKRNGKTKLIWFSSKTTALSYSPKSDEMILTVHRWFANKACPGNWLYNRLGDLAEQVTEKLGGNSATDSISFTEYKARVTVNTLNIRKGAGTNYSINGSIRDNGIYTIVEESDGKGASKWGKLKSGAGWISLDYTTKI